MKSRAPAFVVIGVHLGPVPTVAAVQVSRRQSYASDAGSDGVHVWSTETLKLDPWEDLFPGPAAAQIVEAAYLRSYWHDDAPVCLEEPPRTLPLLGFRLSALYGAVSYGLQHNNRRLQPVSLEAAFGQLGVGGRRGAPGRVARAVGRFAYSAGTGACAVADRPKVDGEDRNEEAIAISLAIAGARQILSQN